MKLKTFRIQNYKIIDDTRPVKVDPKVTTLVGKNESGKTAILKAIWKSRNVADAHFDKLYDYPRDRYSGERKGKQEVTRLEFELSDDDVDELAGQLSPTPTTSDNCILITYYDGEDDIRYEINFAEGLQEPHTGQDAAKAIQAIIEAFRPYGKDVEAVEEAGKAAIQQIKRDAPLWDTAIVTALITFNDAMASWLQADGIRKSVAQEELTALNNIISLAKAQEWAQASLPSFIYFDDYGQLKTRIHLPSYLARKGSSDVEYRTQAALFEWSQLDPEEIMQLGKPHPNEIQDEIHRRLEKREALLQSASFSLTGDWVRWWTGEEHTLHFSTDGDYLVLRVSDAHNPFPIPFEERSHGFQWFFSFYLVFLVESKRAHRGAILLLDEPGLHLHPTLQTKLIEFFERISVGNQLIYSTHLPFLVDGSHFERVRTVHLAGPRPQKTVVSDDVRPTGDRDTLFPLQAALGYSIAQTLFMGKRTLVVEGISDYWIIKVLDECLAGGDRLHEDTVLIPAGGTARLMPLASIMIASMAQVEGMMLVLLDSDSEGQQAAKRLEKTFGGEAPVLMLATALERTEATIEDLVPRGIYAEAVRKRLGRSFALVAREQEAPTNVRALEMVFERKGYGKFGMDEKAVAALTLMGQWGKDVGSIPEETLKCARMLFGAINAHFERLA